MDRHNLPKQLTKNIAENPKKIEKVHKYLLECLSKMKDKQEKMMEKYNFGNPDNKFVLYPERNKFFMFHQKTKKVFFEANFQIVGTYSEKSRTWRWGWSNRYVPYDLKNISNQIKKFGEANGVNIFSEPKIKDENMGLIFTALGMDLATSHGYYIIPGTKVYPFIYVVFTKVKKIDSNYQDIVKQMKNNTRDNQKIMRNKLSKSTTPAKKTASKKSATLTKKQKPPAIKKSNSNKGKSNSNSNKGKSNSKKKKPSPNQNKKNRNKKITLLKKKEKKILIPLKKKKIRKIKIKSPSPDRKSLETESLETESSEPESSEPESLETESSTMIKLNLSNNNNSNHNLIPSMSMNKKEKNISNKNNKSQKILVPVKKKIIKRPKQKN